MTDVVVTHKFPGGAAGQILPLDARTQKQVDAGNARILPAGSDSHEDAEPAEQVGRMRGTGNSDDRAALELVQSDYDELTGPGEKGPEGFTEAELEQLTSPSEDD